MFKQGCITARANAWSIGWKYWKGARTL